MSKNLFNKNEFLYLIEPKDLKVDDVTGKISRPAITDGNFLMTVYDSQDPPVAIPGLTAIPFVQAGTSGVYYVKGPGEKVPAPSDYVWVEFTESGLYANRCYWYFKRNVNVRSA